jgi:hypothetical protein
MSFNAGNVWLLLQRGARLRAPRISQEDAAAAAAESLPMQGNILQMQLTERVNRKAGVYTRSLFNSI